MCFHRNQRPHPEQGSDSGRKWKFVEVMLSELPLTSKEALLKNSLFSVIENHFWRSAPYSSYFHLQTNEHINLKVLGQDNAVVQFKIKRATPLRKLMNAYCDRAVSWNQKVWILKSEAEILKFRVCQCKWSASASMELQSTRLTLLPHLRWRKETLSKSTSSKPVDTSWTKNAHELVSKVQEIIEDHHSKELYPWWLNKTFLKSTHVSKKL